MGCTDDSCDEGTASVLHVPNPAQCSNGQYCDGSEVCDVTLDCQPGSAPSCDDGVSCTVDSCNEAADSCDHVADDSLCNNGLFCDGIEVCSAVSDCQPGTAPTCNDGVACTDDSCNESLDACQASPNDANCDDSQECTADACGALGCTHDPLPNGTPCSVGTCDGAGVCVPQCQSETTTLSAHEAAARAYVVNESCGGGGGGSQAIAPFPGAGDFEQSGDLATWSGDCTQSSSQVHGGSFSMRCGGTQGATATLDATGQSGITVNYWRYGSSLESGEWYYIEWSADGASWTEIEQDDDDPSGWQQRSAVLPAAADNAPALRIRVRTEMSSSTSDAVYLDDVQVTGESACVQPTWYAVGSAELLGTDSASVVTLHEEPFGSGTWVTGPCGCSASEVRCQGLRLETCNGAGQWVLVEDCDDGVACSVDSCDSIASLCGHAPDDGACDNALYCDGAETCDLLAGCQVGTPPSCDDSVACTLDSCNEVSDSCDHSSDDGLCDNTDPCDGAETCDPVLDCQPGTPLQCDNPNECTANSCASGLGCQTSFLPPGTPCTAGQCDGMGNCVTVEECTDGIDNEGDGFIDCDDPQCIFHLACCTPRTCAGLGAECGEISNGCGGFLDCGTCPQQATNPRFGCVSNRCLCSPLCGDSNECGDDGCGGSCGPCDPGESCNAVGQCECAPQCAGRQCGDDGCGGSCGSCVDGEGCSLAGLCECPAFDSGSPDPAFCTPSCPCDEGQGGCDDNLDCYAGLFCNDTVALRFGLPDGFGVCWRPECEYPDPDHVLCGTTSSPCGLCPGCPADCRGRVCGDDGCGGSCGSCGAGEVCVNGDCCQPSCDLTGATCGPDGCGGICGSCLPGDTCTPEGFCGSDTEVDCLDDSDNDGDGAIDCDDADCAASPACGACGGFDPQNPDPNFCSLCSCSVGEGDCDDDAQCQGSLNLACREDWGSRFGLPADFDVCVPDSCEPGDCGDVCGSCDSCQQTSCVVDSLPPATLDFAAGQFTRASSATHHIDATTLVEVGADVPRYEDRGDTNGPLLLFEGARRNYLHDGSEGSTAATVSTSPASAPLPLESARRLTALDAGGGAGARQDLSFDDFASYADSSELSAVWTLAWSGGASSSDVGLSASGAGGTQGVFMRDDFASITLIAPVDVSAHSAIEVSYDRSTEGLDSGETFRAEVSADGASYTTIETIVSSGSNQAVPWATTTVALDSVGLGGASQVFLRFSLTASYNGDLAYVDNVRVTGLSAGGSSQHLYTRYDAAAPSQLTYSAYLQAATTNSGHDHSLVLCDFSSGGECAGVPATTAVLASGIGSWARVTTTSQLQSPAVNALVSVPEFGNTVPAGDDLDVVMQQLEDGAFASSYMTYNGRQRQADVLQYPGGAPQWMVDDFFVFYVHPIFDSAQAPDGRHVLLQFGAGSQDYLALVMSGGQAYLAASDSDEGGEVATTNLFSFSANELIEIVVAPSLGGVDAATTSTIAGSALTGSWTWPTTVPLFVGSDNGADAAFARMTPPVRPGGGNGYVCSETPRPEGASCGGTASCIAGMCTPSVRCGDGMRDLGDAGEPREGCDDGNTLSGDACSPQCEPELLIIASEQDGVDEPKGPTPSVGVDAAGNLLFIWVRELPPDFVTGTDGGLQLLGRRVSPQGVPLDPESDPLIIAEGFGLGWPVEPSITGLSGAGWAVVWTDPTIDGDGSGIALRTIVPDGSMSAIQQANTTTLFGQRQPTIAVFAGSMSIAFVDESGVIAGGTGLDVRSRTFEEPLGTADSVATQSDTALTGAPGDQFAPASAGSATGFAVAWSEDSGSELNVRGLVIASGLFRGFTLNEPGTQGYESSVAATPGDDFVFTWIADDPAAGLSRVHARTVVGGQAGELIDVAPGSRAPSVTAYGSQDAIISWHGSSVPSDIDFAVVDLGGGASLAPESARLREQLTAAGNQRDGGVVADGSSVWFTWSDDRQFRAERPRRAYVAYRLPLD